MSIHPTGGLPDSASTFPADSPQSPVDETEEKPLKSGKWCGILSILCGLEPMLVIGFGFLVNVLVINYDISPPSGFLLYVFRALFFGAPLCVIAGILFGIWGRKTEGIRYANVGLVISSLSTLLVLGIAAMIVHSILVPCC